MRTVTRTKELDKHPAAVLAVALFAIAVVAGVLFRHEVVGSNVYAFGIALGGMTPAQAAQVVSAKAREVEKGPLTFVAGSLSTQVTETELKLLLDDAKMISDLAGTVSPRSRLIPSFILRLGAKTAIAAPARVVSADTDKVFGRIAAALSRDATGTRYGFAGKDLTVLPPESGQTVTKDDVRKALESVSGTNIQVPFKQLPAPVPKDLPALSLIGEFSTPYNQKETDRNVNLSLAAQAIHGRTLQPGEVYSFNREAGERTEAKGYRYANVVVGDHLEPGLAGGICQVTTTLFDAAAMAGLDFPEVNAHGIPVDYVPPGKDAAVAWDYLDIKVRNGTASPVVFGAWVENGSVTVRVYGKASDKTYELLPVIVRTIPAQAPKEPGLVVDTYRVEKVNGQEVKRVLLMRSEYLPYVKVTPKG